MKTSRTTFRIAATAAVVSVVAWLSTRPTTDPVYEGRRLSHWFTQLSQPAGQAERKKAEQAIRAIGPEAIPFLVRQLHASASAWRREHERFYSAKAQRLPHWLNSLFPNPRADEAAWTRAQAAMALGWLGDKAKPAASDLAKALGDGAGDVSWFAANVPTSHQNPVKHGLVPVANQYPWCSARWFERSATPAQIKTIYRFKTDQLKVPDDFEVSPDW